MMPFPKTCTSNFVQWKLVDENSIFSSSTGINAITYPSVSWLTVGKKRLTDLRNHNIGTESQWYWGISLPFADQSEVIKFSEGPRNQLVNLISF